MERPTVGPALETFLQLVGLLVVLVAVFVVAARPFWPRLVRLFRQWAERDRRQEALRQRQLAARQEEARALAEHRARAEAELRICLGRGLGANDEEEERR
jgi:hypothetical protein